MKRIDRLFYGILAKWIILIIVVLVLWYLKVFHALLWLVLFISQEFMLFLAWLTEPTQAGAEAYWAEYWPVWMLIYIVLLVLLIGWYFLWYRHKRPYLDVGGGREGRVLWMKGVRRGAIYAVWDAKKYLSWKLKKNHLGKIRRRISVIPNGEKVDSTMWPDPLAIQLGRPTSRRIIYFSRPWRLKVEMLTIPNNLDMSQRYLKIQIPEGYIVNRPDPLSPGETMQVLVNDRPDNREYTRGQMRTDLMEILDETRDAVQASAAANPQLIHRDYEDGSFPILRDEEVVKVDG